ncbi:MAG TPA: hypothetical protein VKV33_07880 [Streptosporangiaceae bacterium]|nr:hypothetical protein [Streptosporangiaceae bacterium]
MKSGICLFWIAVGAILTFAVTANTSVFNLHVAGFVIMVIGIIGLVTPKRGYEWLGRRVYVKRYRRGNVAQVEETAYPPYVLRNPGTANQQADIPDRPSLEPDPGVARWQEPAQTPEEEMATQRATIHGADRYDDMAPPDEPPPPAAGPTDTEVTEDVYEEPPA